MIAAYRKDDGTFVPEANFSLAAGHARACRCRDGRTGRSCRRCRLPALPRDFWQNFLHNYLGMIGIPIALQATFPSHHGTILLTEAAKHSPDIVAKISAHLLQGNNVVVTSGLYRALQGGKPGSTIEDIRGAGVTGAKATVNRVPDGLAHPGSLKGSIMITCPLYD